MQAPPRAAGRGRGARPSRSPSWPEPEPDAEPARLPAVVGATPRAGGQWQLPKISLLSATKQLSQDLRQLEVAGQTLVAALEAHGVATTLLGKTVGPTVTRFELELGAGVKVARVTSLARDIAYAMASPDVRILAPIPGKSAIGVEVPNRTRQLVALRDILDSAGGQGGHPPARSGHGSRHRGAGRHGQSGRDAPHPDLGRHRCRQVLLYQLDHHLGAHAQHTRAGPAHADRPQAGGARTVQRAAAPDQPGGGRPQEGGQRPAVGRQGDGAALRPAGRERDARHHRVQPRPRRRGAHPYRTAIGQEAHGRNDRECARLRPPCRLRRG